VRDFNRWLEGEKVKNRRYDGGKIRRWEKIEDQKVRRSER
jgi:hypothetical protein